MGLDLWILGVVLQNERIRHLLFDIRYTDGILDISAPLRSEFLRFMMWPRPQSGLPSRVLEAKLVDLILIVATTYL